LQFSIDELKFYCKMQSGIVGMSASLKPGKGFNQRNKFDIILSELDIVKFPLPPESSLINSQNIGGFLK